MSQEKRIWVKVLTGKQNVQDSSLSDEERSFRAEMKERFQAVAPSDVIQLFKPEYCGLCCIKFSCEKFCWKHYNGRGHAALLNKKTYRNRPLPWQMVFHALISREPVGASKEQIQTFIENTFSEHLGAGREVGRMVEVTLEDMVERFHNVVNIDMRGIYKLRDRSPSDRPKPIPTGCDREERKVSVREKGTNVRDRLNSRDWSKERRPACREGRGAETRRGDRRILAESFSGHSSGDYSSAVDDVFKVQDRKGRTVRGGLRSGGESRRDLGARSRADLHRTTAEDSYRRETKYTTARRESCNVPRWERQHSPRRDRLESDTRRDRGEVASLGERSDCVRNDEDTRDRTGRRSVSSSQQETHRERSRSEPRRPHSQERSIDSKNLLRVPDNTPPRPDDYLHHHLHPLHLSFGPVGSPRDSTPPPPPVFYRHHSSMSAYPNNSLLTPSHFSNMTETQSSMLDTQGHHYNIVFPPSIVDVVPL